MFQRSPVIEVSKYLVTGWLTFAKWTVVYLVNKIVYGVQLNYTEGSIFLWNNCRTKLEEWITGSVSILTIPPITTRDLVFVWKRGTFLACYKLINYPRVVRTRDIIHYKSFVIIEGVGRIYTRIAIWAASISRNAEGVHMAPVPSNFYRMRHWVQIRKICTARSYSLPFKLRFYASNFGFIYFFLVLLWEL